MRRFLLTTMLGALFALNACDELTGSAAPAAAKADSAKANPAGVVDTVSRVDTAKTDTARRDTSVAAALGAWVLSSVDGLPAEDTSTGLVLAGGGTGYFFNSGVKGDALTWTSTRIMATGSLASSSATYVLSDGKMLLTVVSSGKTTSFVLVRSSYRAVADTAGVPGTDTGAVAPVASIGAGAWVIVKDHMGDAVTGKDGLLLLADGTGYAVTAGLRGQSLAWSGSGVTITDASGKAVLMDFEIRDGILTMYYEGMPLVDMARDPSVSW